MIDTDILESFHSQFDELIAVSRQSNARLLFEPPDELFFNHQNVFIKAYLVSACSILEAFIQDLAYEYLKTIQMRVEETNLPHNVILWSTSIGKDDEKLKKRQKFEPFKITKNKKSISDMVSGNYHKTMETFKVIGIDLSCDVSVSNHKDFISTTIDKRNQIVHHNDDASDLSLTDIATTIEHFKEYASELHRVVCSSPHLPPPPS